MALLPAVLAVAAMTTAAPVPKAPPVPVYFPTSVGAKWVYQNEYTRRTANGGGSGSAVITEAVSSIDKRDGRTVVTVMAQGPEEKQPRKSREVVVSPAGLGQLDFDRTVGVGMVQPYFLTLRSPAGSKDKWECTWGNPGEPNHFIGKARTYAPTDEDVWVKGLDNPTGTFPAVRVAGSGTAGDATVEFTAWYAPEIGLVKYYHTIMGVQREETLSVSLVSFSSEGRSIGAFSK